MSIDKRPLKVFLCYAHTDMAKVRALYSDLVREGLDLWFDQEKLLPGTDWKLAIQEAVEDADVVIVCLSKQFNQAGFRQREVRLALDTAMEKPEGDIFIIPARLEVCENLKSLRKWQWVDLFDQSGYRRLMLALNAKADRIDAAFKLEPQYKAVTPSDELFVQKVVETIEPTPRPWKILTGIVAIILVVVILLAISRFFSRSPTTKASETSPSVTETVKLSSSLSMIQTDTQTANPVTQISIAESFPAPGSRAEGITWDGTSLWVTDNSGFIFKMDPSGKLLDSIAAPEVTPQGITWDGSSFWLFTTNQSFIYQFRILESVAETISSFRSPGIVIGGDLSQDMAWDGDSLWYANQFKVYNLSNSGEVLDSLTFPKNVSGLDWDGTNLWLAYNDFPGNAVLNKVNKIGDSLETYPSPISEINGLAWSDGYLWALGIDSIGGKPMIYKLDIAS